MRVTTLRERSEALARLPRLGGSLSLDFLNTIDHRQGPRAHDFLRDYTDLAVWSANVDAVDQATATRLIRLAGNSDEAASVFARAIELREALYRIFRTVLTARRPRKDDLERLQSEVHAALAGTILRADGTGFRWDWDERLTLERPLWPIVHDAAELLTASEVRRVKLCPGRDCGWLFLDASKNQSRRWCSMDTCGSREKMRRLHARRRRSEGRGRTAPRSARPGVPSDDVMGRDLYILPPELPVPEDDGAADGLEGTRTPELRLASTLGRDVDLRQASSSRLVLYVYPRTGVPGEPSPPGWDQIPGARGCTPENCAFRDHERELRELGATVMGLSSQPFEEQCEFAERERIPYPLLNDSRLALARMLGLPTFEVAGMTLFKRLTLVAEHGTIVKAFYPVFPPDRHPEEVIAWLRDRPLAGELDEG